MWYNSPINAEIIKFIQSFSNSFLDVLFQLITMMGEEPFFMGAALLIYWCINKNFGYRLAFAYLSNNLINNGVKEILKVPRPIGEPGIRSLRIETAGGYSFPSGHTQSAASFWTSIIIEAKKRWMYIVGPIMIVLVAVSRLYLGVHRPVDVVVGMIMGVLWVFVSNLMFDYADKTGRKEIFLLILVPMVIVMFLLPIEGYYKVAGTVLGFYMGYVIEPRYIKFQVKAGLWIQVMKFVTGFAGLMAIRILLKPLLPQAMLSDFFRYLLMGVWATIGAPYLFRLLPGYTSMDRTITR